MGATITVSVRIPLAQAKVIKRAAKAKGLKLATYIREAAFHTADQNPDMNPVVHFRHHETVGT
jgi:uncharacterized protein (DUF1778 family)